jgi:hypothetical protein
MSRKNSTLASLKFGRTKANTKFMDWWPMFNKELATLGRPEAGFTDAYGAWEVGETPETAASYLAYA